MNARIQEDAVNLTKFPNVAQGSYAAALVAFRSVAKGVVK